MKKTKEDSPKITVSEEEKTKQQMLSTEMFVYPLIKAVQELSAKVEELESKLNGE